MRRQIVIRPDTKLVRIGGSPTQVTWLLLAAQLVIFVVYAFADGPRWVGQHLALSSGQALGLFELWQPLTAPWIHLTVKALLVNLLSLWLFGQPLQRWWGPRRFVVFWIVTGAAGMLLPMMVGMLWPQQVIAGSGAAAMATLSAFSLLHPEHMIFFYGVLPLRAKWLGLILGGIIVLGSLLAPAPISERVLELALYVGGVVVSLFFIHNPKRLAAQRAAERAKRSLKVIEGGKTDRDPPKYWN